MGQTEDRKIQDYLSRPARYANVDGAAEMTSGLVWIGLGLVDWTPKLGLGSSRFVSKLLGMTAFLAWLALAHLASRRFKNRVTYRRTGYVAYPARRQKWVSGLAAVTAALVSAAVAFLAARKQLRLEWLTGPILTIFYAFLARPYRWWRVSILAMMSAGSLATPFLYPDASGAIRNAVFGALYVLSGLFTLTDYLRNSRPPEPVTE